MASPVQSKPLRRLGAFAIFTAALFAGRHAVRASAEDVYSITVSKSQSYFQYGPFDFVQDPFFFAGDVNVVSWDYDSILDGRFAPPNGVYIPLSPLGDGDFAHSETFTDLAAWNAAFPSGTYWFDLLTVTNPTSYQAFINLTERFPAPPRVTNEFYSGVIQLDYRNDFTYRWADFVGFSSSENQPSAIQFELINLADQPVYQKRSFSAVTSITVPGYTLQPGFYLGRVLFAHTDHAEDQFTAFEATSATGTVFLISTIDGPPVIREPLSATVTVGQLFVYVIDASNAPGSFGVDATKLPAGVIYDTSFGWIAGFPDTPGKYEIPISASNTLGTGPAVLTLTVEPDDAALAIKSSTTAAGSKDKPFKFQVLVTGATSDARIAADGLPAGLQINDESGEISGTPTEAGKFMVTLSVSDAGSTAEGQLELTFSADAAFPAITSAHAVTIAPGQEFYYKIEASSNGDAPGDQTTFKLAGDLPAGLSFDPQTGIISGRFATRAAKAARGGQVKHPLTGGVVVGTIQLFANNSRGTATIPLVFFTPPVGAVNISTRMGVESGDNVLIGGFIVTGNAPKKLVLRAIGPSLKGDGGAPLPGTLQDPVLEIYSAGDDQNNNVPLATNDNWKSDHQQELIDTSIPPSDDREAAIVGAFDPGFYTAVVRGKNGAAGVGLVELYDLGTASLNTTSTAKLAQISTRGRVQAGENVMIGGFIISGPDTKVIVRAIGPSLRESVPGALIDTTLELRDGNGELVASNDNWRSSQEEEIKSTFVPPADDHESAIVKTLAAGGYTAIVRGKDGTTGIALVEVYVLQ